MKCDLCEDHVMLTFSALMEYGSYNVSKNVCAKCIIMESRIKISSEVRLA